MWQGSRAQLEEVWKEEDGLEDQEFNPKTFFRMHGSSHGVITTVIIRS